MKILIAADMEGITGVVTWDQVTPGHFEHHRFRELMTADVNAAVQGAFEAGAQDVTVTDGHSMGANILIEDLDPRVRLNCGSPSPYSMMQGIEEVDGVMFVGYHARAGTPAAILDHTWSSRCVRNVWLNDVLVGEYGLNAALAGYFDVPVLMVSGDQNACAQVVELLGEVVETAVVKQALGRFAAECLSPQSAQAVIRQAAVRAVKKLKEGKAAEPFHFPGSIRLRVEFASSDMVDRATQHSGVAREGTCVSVLAEDMPEAYRSFRGLVALAAG